MTDHRTENIPVIYANFYCEIVLCGSGWLVNSYPTVC